MIFIHDKEVNKIAECNLLNYIINPPKRTKNLNINYSHILHVCMNTRHGRSNFKNFRILLGSVHRSTIVMGSLVEKLHPEKHAVIQWHTQAGDITNNINVKVDYTLPAISATNVMTWNCHVDGSAKDIYYMILVQYLLI